LKCCLRHFVRPESPLNRKGVGDCTVCEPHEDNKKCAMYVEITYVVCDIKEKEDD
jgi:hypothetical protein